jgi:hypothetical protein
VGDSVLVARLDGSLRRNDGLVDRVIVLREIELCLLAASAGMDNTLLALIHRSHRGGYGPGEVSHSLIWEAVSACRARLRSSSRAVPG